MWSFHRNSIRHSHKNSSSIHFRDHNGVGVDWSGLKISIKKMETLNIHLHFCHETLCWFDLHCYPRGSDGGCRRSPTLRLFLSPLRHGKTFVIEENPPKIQDDSLVLTTIIISFIVFWKQNRSQCWYHFLCHWRVNTSFFNSSVILFLIKCTSCAKFGLKTTYLVVSSDFSLIFT